MMMHPDKKVVFTCNSCKDQEDGPQCVKWCPEEALTLVTSDVLAQKARISAVKKLFQEAKKKK
jgi:Fe-S-cluster-containing hydrogenase component 2